MNKTNWRQSRLTSIQSIFNIFRETSCQRGSRSGRVGSGWFIISNDSAGPKTVIHLYLTFFRFFLKVLEPIKCRQADPYMTAKGTSFASLTRKNTTLITSFDVELDYYKCAPEIMWVITSCFNINCNRMHLTFMHSRKIFMNTTLITSFDVKLDYYLRPGSNVGNYFLVLCGLQPNVFDVYAFSENVCKYNSN